MNTWKWTALVTTTALSLAVSACGDDDSDTSGMGGDVATGGTSTGGTSTGGVDGSGAAMATGGGGGAECDSIVEIASATPELSTLVAALTKANLVSAVEQEGLTVFAPTNDAFADLLAAVGATSLDDLTAEQLAPILTYHVASGVVDSTAAVAEASDSGTLTTLGGTVTLSVDGEDLVIDADESPGTVTMADVEACNGIVHVIDGVLLPSITDVVTTSDDYSELNGLIAAADSTETIAGVLDGPATAVDGDLDPGAFTLFAPTNMAITTLVASLPSPLSGAQLDSVLQYHVYASDEAVDAATALTLSEADIEMLTGDIVTVDGGSTVDLEDADGGTSQVVIADIYTANGIIHRIDGVLTNLQ